MSKEASSADQPCIAMVAGEASGDLLASGLLKDLNHRDVLYTAEGVAGPQMIAQGMQALYPSDRLAVRGYSEVLRHYWGIVRIRNELIHRWTQSNTSPAVFIGVDAPDFNLPLALNLKQQGTPCFQYVSPAIWAWRAERIHLMKKALSHVWCLFPFEEPLLRDRGMEASFVGHPLAQWIPESVDQMAFKTKLELDGDRPVMAILPGSRRAEIEALLVLFLKTAQQLLKSHPELQFVLPTLPRFVQQVQQHVDTMGLTRQVKVLLGQSHDAMAASDLVLVASGTATLEAALYQKPMVIAYKMPWLTWQITRRKKTMPWVGLPNILLNEWVVPELIQDDCTPSSLASECNRLLTDPAKTLKIQAQFSKLHRMLKKPTHELIWATLEPHLHHAKAV